MDRLATTAFNFPAIDNHAHPLLKAEYRSQVPFEVLISEATDKGLTVDATNTLACWRAASQLGRLLELPEYASSWADVKAKRDATDYDELCEMFMRPCKIQSILLDDGLGGVSEWAEDWKWHRKFGCDTKRIVRVEIEAENILKRLFEPYLQSSLDDGGLHVYNALASEFQQCITDNCNDSEVVAFKSIACYRTGLNITSPFELINEKSLLEDVTSAFTLYKETRNLRLAFRILNDWIVHTTLRIAGQSGKPVQFHTGLGDSDISLVHSSPAHMQPIIKEYPSTKIVLLHSSYPYTREAGYLTAVYENVFCDFGEIFPFVSAAGQRAVVRDVLDLCPTNKILWSTDGHWFPETFYLGTIQARQALYIVLAEMVKLGDLSESQAVTVVENALFHNANRLYKLGLTPML